VQVLSSKLDDVITAARPHLTNEEFRELGELLTKYEDISAGDNEDYGRTNKVYHRIDAMINPNTLQYYRCIIGTDDR
jgi:hypothetical protein